MKKPPENPNEVDAITGATISSRSVVNIINAADAIWVPRLVEAGVQPSLPPAGAGGETPSQEQGAGEGGGA